MKAQYDPISILQNDLEESLGFVVVDVNISVNKSSPLWQDDRHEKSLSDYSPKGGKTKKKQRNHDSQLAQDSRVRHTN